MGDLDGTPQWSKFQAELDVAIEETVFVAFFRLFVNGVFKCSLGSPTFDLSSVLVYCRKD